MYGLHVHEAVIAARERLSGATVHYVDEEYDHGRIVLQRSVPVFAEDTRKLLPPGARAEHALYPTRSGSLPRCTLQKSYGKKTPALQTSTEQPRKVPPCPLFAARS